MADPEIAASRRETEVRLAAERTALSWRRTGLGAVAVALLLVQMVLAAGWDRSALAPGAACLFLLAVAAIGYRRNRRLRTVAALPRPSGLGWVSLAVIATAVVTAGFVLTAPESADRGFDGVVSGPPAGSR